MPEDNDAMSQSSEGTFFQHSILYTGKFLTRLEDKKRHFAQAKIEEVP